ncbi:MAG: metal-dependent transcriptional regulator [Spirochaetaceae bacterium]|nr:metal-dependent transcriptional regulator [Spirochaetaceae bacterium]
MTKSLEDYLEVIGNLAEQNANPRVKDIAAVLGISKPSVHTALHLLEDKGMIEHEHYGAIILTTQGKIKYQEIKDKHDTLKRFLIEKIGVSEKNAEHDACAMEHILSEETFEKIKALLH